MKIRRPLNQQAPRVKHPRNGNNGARLVDPSEYRNANPSEDLPVLPKYDEHMSAGKKDSWFKKAKPYLRAFLAEGLSKEEIKKRLNLKNSQYDKLEASLIEEEAGKYTSMGIAHRFYLFSLQIEMCVRQLDVYINKNIHNAGRQSGIVGAVKAKAELYKQLIATGQELGIIDKRAKEVRMLGDINLPALPTEELQELLLSKMQQFTDMIQGPNTLPRAFERLLDNAERVSLSRIEVKGPVKHLDRGSEPVQYIDGRICEAVEGDGERSDGT